MERTRNARGFSLIEVLIALLVLAFGLLALSALQVSLFRSGAETKARAFAASMAQGNIENLRSFRQLSSGAGGSAYEDITTQALPATTLDGTTLHGCVQVRRYRLDSATNRFAALNEVNFNMASSGATVAVTCVDRDVTAAPLRQGVPEFKEVRVSVGWLDAAQQLQKIELTDTIAADSPTDQAFLARDPRLSSRQPEVWIRPPNRDADGNLIPEVVPIAVGDDTASAGSNPKPQLFVDQLSAATTFGVKTFSGTDPNEVLLNRNLEVAATSCICSRTNQVSSASDPAFLPTTWNGRLRNYEPPEQAPAGKPVGIAVLDNADRSITSLCTACCRDHHDAAGQSVLFDPFRAWQRRLIGSDTANPNSYTYGDTTGEHTHWGYRKQGRNYLLERGLTPLGTPTANEYVEACRLVRVDGVMRVAVDARMNEMVATSLNNSASAFENASFSSLYSSYIKDYLHEAVGGAVASTAGPLTALPPPSPALRNRSSPNYSSIINPQEVALYAEGQQHNLVTFGLYVDYLTQDTLHAYRCARDASGYGARSDCAGLRTRNALEALPFYAVNVANVGAWTSAQPTVASVTNIVYTPQGNKASDGGVVAARSGVSDDPFPVYMAVQNSNSGLTGTLPVDIDDASAWNQASDAQSFRKRSGTATSPRRDIRIVVRESSLTQLTRFDIVSAARSCDRITAVGVAYDDIIRACELAGTSITVTFANYSGAGANDRQICLPNSTGRPGDPVFSAAVVSNNARNDETTTVTISSLTASAPPLYYALTVDIGYGGQSCTGGLGIYW
jgi:type IV pilus modification protein PilV